MCCALHDCLLEVDNLDEEWMHGAASEWEGGFGNHHSADVQEHAPNFAIQWLNFPEALRTFDASGNGCGTNAEEGNNDGGKEEEEHVGDIPAPGLF
jgi:hypothetical protein